MEWVSTSIRPSLAEKKSEGQARLRPSSHSQRLYPRTGGSGALGVTEPVSKASESAVGSRGERRGVRTGPGCPGPRGTPSSFLLGVNERVAQGGPGSERWKGLDAHVLPLMQQPCHPLTATVSWVSARSLTQKSSWSFACSVCCGPLAPHLPLLVCSWLLLHDLWTRADKQVLLVHFVKCTLSST